MRLCCILQVTNRGVVMKLPVKILLYASFIMLGVFSMAGCFSTAENNEKIKVTNETKAEEQSIEHNIDLFEFTKNKEELDKLNEEFSKLKKSVNRVLELESDLQYLVDMIELKTKPDVSFMPEISLAEQRNPAELLQNEKFSQSEQNNTPSESVRIDSKFSNVVVKAAKRIDNVQTTDLSPKQLNNESTINSVQENQVDLSKFSKALPHSISKCEPPPIGKGYSIHIASFQKKSSAVSILNDMLPKVNAETPCPLAGLIDEVKVDNRLFYSSRLGSFSTKSEATNACLVARRFNDYCAVTINTGVEI